MLNYSLCHLLTKLHTMYINGFIHKCTTSILVQIYQQILKKLCKLYMYIQVYLINNGPISVYRAIYGVRPTFPYLDGTYMDKTFLIIS